MKKQKPKLKLCKWTYTPDEVRLKTAFDILVDHYRKHEKEIKEIYEKTKQEET